MNDGRDLDETRVIDQVVLDAHFRTDAAWDLVGTLEEQLNATKGRLAAMTTSEAKTGNSTPVARLTGDQALQGADVSPPGHIGRHTGKGGAHRRWNRRSF